MAIVTQVLGIACMVNIKLALCYRVSASCPHSEGPYVWVSAEILLATTATHFGRTAYVLN